MFPSPAFAFAILIVITTTRAQHPPEKLPPCAEACSQQAGLLSGCALTDPACYCKSAIFLGTVESCEISNCTIEDQRATLRVSGRVCESFGGVASINPTLNPSAASVIIESQASAASTARPDASTANQQRIASILASFPECGKSCAIQASQASGCLLTDPGCFCTNKEFLVLSDACESKSCTLEEQKYIIRVSPSLCANVAGALPSVNPTLNPSAATAELTSIASASVATPTAIVTGSTSSPGNGSVAPALPAPSSMVPYTGQAAPRMMGGSGAGILGTVMLLGAGVAVLAWL